MVERRTRVVVEAQAKGFEKTKRSVKGTFDPAKRGAKETNQEMRGLDKTVESLNKHLAELNRSFKTGAQEGKRAFQELRREIKALNQEMAGAGRPRDSGGRFLPGAAAGGVAGFLAGRMGRGGRGAARFGGGVAGAGFSGVGGMATALSGIPVVGGFLAGQLQNLMATSGAGLQSFQQRQALLPMMNAPGLAMELEEASGRARGRNRIFQTNEALVRAAGTRAVRAEERRRAQRARATVDVRGGAATFGQVPSIAEMQSDPFGPGFDPTSRGAFGQFEAGMARQRVDNTAEVARSGAEKAERERQKGEVAKSRARRRRAVRRARARVRNAPFNPLLDIGVGGGGRRGMGVMSQDLLQFAGGLANAAGGSVQEFAEEGQGQEFFRQALGARQILGINQQVSGAFARGARQGVIGGGMGGAGAAFTRSIGQAMKLGLEGSELTRFMQMAAQSLMSFEQTGMPLDPAALGNVGMAMARAGLGGVRGTNVAQQLIGAGQNLSTQGPQSAVQLLMFREMFGFKGGGLAGFAGAQRRAEAGKIEEGGVQKFVQTLLQGATSADEGQLRLQAAFQQLGVRVGAGEAFRLAGGDPSTTAKIQEELRRSLMRKEAFDRAGGPADLAEDLTPEAVGRQTRIDRRRRGIGRGTIGVAQTFEEGQLGVTGQIARLAPEINTAAKTLGDAATGVAGTAVDLIKRIEALVERAEGLNVGK